MTQVKTAYVYGEQRVEIELTNGQKLTVMVNSDSGKVSILSNAPHIIGHNKDVVQTDGYYKDKAMPQNIVEIEYYGVPFGD